MGKDQTVLFHSTIFGPVHSRRLGTSLGVNLTPDDGKVCTFDCLYCEAGFNAQGTGTTGLPSREQVKERLRSKLSEMTSQGQRLDAITFSGNGEPTVHPEFAAILSDTLALRDEFFPEAKVSVLSNSTRLDDPAVREALLSLGEGAILKADSAVESTMRRLDRPVSKKFTVQNLLEHMKPFAGRATIQTMMLRGNYGGEVVDNTTPEEIDAFIDFYRKARPARIMLYSIDRKTPAENLERVPKEELAAIAARIEKETGIPVQVN